MRTSTSRFHIAFLCSLAITASHATTILYVDDQFTDGASTDGADAKDIAWYVNNTGSSTTSSVGTDAIINTGNALRMNTTATFRKFIGVFSSTITISQGETLQLGFDYRFHETANVGGVFRFGLFNNGGTSASANGTVADSNNFGYAGTTNPGADSASGTRVAYEAAGDAVLGGSTPGALVLIGPSGSSVNSGTSSKGSVLFSVTRNLDDSISLSSSINGLSAASVDFGSPATSPQFLNYDFHEVAIGLGGSAADFSIDNVVVQVVPEPSAALLGVLGSLLLLRRRR